MSKSARRTYRTGLSREIVADAALALTAERGLDGWSMRDLTTYLDTSLSVIYHHVGDKEHVCAAVVDRIYAQMDLPIDETDWRALLHGVLSAMIENLTHYPGVAAWLLRNGPRTEQLMPVLDAGVTRMLDAGWGDEAAAAYSVAFNTCLGLISLGDHQVGDGDPGLTELGHMLDLHPSAGPGAKQMQDLVVRFTDAAADRDGTRREYCRYALDRILDGLEMRLREIERTRRSSS